MHPNSWLIFEKYAAPFFNIGMKVLEIGPDSFPSTYQKIILKQNPSIDWHTIDVYDHPSLTYKCNSEYSFPIADNFYDIVLSGQVIEHVKKPWKWMPELARITKFNGLVITINPVSWPYHEAPVDCWRMYPEGMKALYEEANLEVAISQWESLETPHFRRFLPGRSRQHTPRVLRAFSELLGRLGYPVERSYDTVTVGRKGMEKV